MPSISPYLFFDGTCREAMTAYADIFGTKIDMIMTFADAPAGEEMPDVPPDLVMHSSLSIGGQMLMASDDVPGRTVSPASTYVMVSLADVATAQTAFERLAEGGEVMMPFTKTFWSEGFGTLRDRWGQLWMVGVDSEEA
ncbi:VOC family protein [Tropicimonas marinistellae]|uniref:VOC family protein n=1 Tax=Tropicimonas marinistellae TaxID=1739787 RepID=UPI0008316093|nr:VOC family protein [Tropicimonas marinistellae]